MRETFTLRGRFFSVLFPVIFFSVFFLGLFSACIQTATRRHENIVHSLTLKEKIGLLFWANTALLAHDPDAPTPTLSDEKMHSLIGELHVVHFFNTLSRTGNSMPRRQWLELANTLRRHTHQSYAKVGRPLLAVDAIHGNGFDQDAILFAQPLAQASTYTPLLSQKIGQHIGQQLHAACIDMTFSPTADLYWHPAWPRGYETYGANAAHAAEWVKGIVTGLQQTGIAATIKHYHGYGASNSGRDRTPARLSTEDLYELSLPFVAAWNASVSATMMAPLMINGQHAHLTVPEKKHFAGLVLADWNEFHFMAENHHVTSSAEEAVEKMLRAGVDAFLIGDSAAIIEKFYTYAQQRPALLPRIDQAAKNILRFRNKQNLANFAPCSPPSTDEASHTRLAQELAEKSLILLKNETRLLPLPHLQNVVLLGPTAHAVTALTGGWSGSWQGSSERSKHHGPLAQAFAAHGGAVLNYQDLLNGDKSVVQSAKNAAAIVVAIGETSYAEYHGNIPSLTLPQEQLDLLRLLTQMRKPLIAIYLGGRPRTWSGYDRKINAIIASFYPGPLGGKALIETLLGKVSPQGRLPIDWPQEDIGKISNWRTYRQLKPLFSQGHGLSY